jgi:GT2 family glycosyltransferase
LAASDAYRSQVGFETEIIVVEDAGGDDTPQWLQSRYPREVRLISHETNRGFPSACQTGFEAARFPLVLLLNNDVRLRPDAIAPMVHHFSDRSVFAVTGRMFNQAETTFCNGGKVARFRRGMWSTFDNYDVLPEKEAESDSLLSFAAIGAFSLYDREKFLQIGGFDPLIYMIEDIELSYRAWKRGWLVKYEPRANAFHDASRTMKRRYDRRSLQKISRRNRLLMHWILLHDPGMFGRHVLSLAGQALVCWLILDWQFYSCLFSGLKKLPVVLHKRKQERLTAVRSDAQLLAMLQAFYRTAPIRLRRT